MEVNVTQYTLTMDSMTTTQANTTAMTTTSLPELMAGHVTSSYPRLVVTLILTSMSSNSSMNSTSNYGPSHYEYYIIIPFLTIIIGLSIVGLLGNLFTIIVIVHNKNMRTTTNYYLLSLAVSDFLVFLLTSPTEILSVLQMYPWVLGDFLCRTRYYFIEACTYTTVLNITTFTVERYIAICHPIKAKTMIKKSRVIKIIVLIWIISFIIALPAATVFIVQVMDASKPQLSVMCFYKSDHAREMLDKFYIYSALVLFVIPMTLISILYSLIARVLSRSELKDGQRNSSFKRRGNCNGRLKTSSFRVDATTRRRKQVVKMLVSSAALLLFEEQDLEMEPSMKRDQIFVPQDDDNSVKIVDEDEDTDELLTIEDDLDKLLKLDKATPKKSPKPQLLPKPKPPPKPTAETKNVAKDEKEDLFSMATGDASGGFGQDDIMKYIKDNTDEKEVTLDLF
uniref:Neuropeptides capa receptor-like n=1 Tax=Saccoglossus kowalevskii TaxID=10224 RepID=A0ABM0M0F8_SACKO|nr:PREDICTED: neuropeptides capa receptor-like [Saccoglossus kowalevskii]